MSTITTINASDNISDSRTTINTNFSNLNTDKMETSVLDTDGTLAANSDSKVATQKAVKTYADTKMPSNYLDTDGTLAANSDTKVATQKATKTYADTKLPKSGGTMTGDLYLGQNALKLNSTLTQDEKWSGITIAGTLGATIAVGKLCYLNNDDGRWELSDANLSDGYDKQLGICLTAGNDGDTTTMLVFGKVRSATFPSFTVGAPLYMSETAGDVTHTQPTTTDAAIRLLGFALTAEDFMFNPSNDYITHT